MSEMGSSRSLPSLGSEAPSDRYIPLPTSSPGEYTAPVQFLSTTKADELETLCQLAAELLEDPLAVQRLSARVLELLQRDLEQQRERHHGYGRRW